ncbi:hypothetical protein FZC84_13755 [Rossellomorea vietnamensis]|uniref:Uncharacterized protein n=1 Tax=Rossellomorea vietnamensis TaxID=218284 RepID=A0A5D4MAP4_9BACI|nr:hypothetical protein [Rossellomorea vietnamensis]TYR98772.1 hypothetical protein FZC84_13755 [Rossellomorea vietnamensis]
MMACFSLLDNKFKSFKGFHPNLQGILFKEMAVQLRIPAVINQEGKIRAQAPNHFKESIKRNLCGEIADSNLSVI